MAWLTYLKNKFVGIFTQKFYGHFPCDRNTREAQKTIAAGWQVYKGLMADTKKAFKGSKSPGKTPIYKLVRRVFQSIEE